MYGPILERGKGADSGRTVRPGPSGHGYTAPVEGPKPEPQLVRQDMGFNFIPSSFVVPIDASQAKTRSRQRNKAIVDGTTPYFVAH